MTAALYLRETLLWWFEALDGRSGHSFVIGLLANPNKGHAYIIRTPAITYLNREDCEVRTLFQDYHLGRELESIEECLLLLTMFGEEPFCEPHLALISVPYPTAMH
jgi:hypothetical protein